MTPAHRQRQTDLRTQQLEELVRDVRRVLSTPGTRAETSLYGQFETFLDAAFSRLGYDVAISQQATSSEGVPDYRVERDGELLGWIELKAVLDKDLDRLDGHDKSQQERFVSGLSNVLYVSGWQWRLFQDASRVGPPVDIGNRDMFNPDALHYPSNETALDELDTMLRTFLAYSGTPYASPAAVVTALAVRAKGLKLALLSVGENGAGSHLRQLHQDFGNQLFKNGVAFTWEKFVDSYVQIATFGVLLWRLESRSEIQLSSHVTLSKGAHPLLYQALSILWSPDARLPILEPLLENLARTANLIRPDLFERAPSVAERRPVPDPILHAYEPFFAEYDRAARETNGVYYTPVDAVSHIVSGVDYLLKHSLNREEWVLDENARFLDPATGTGTFLLGLANEVAFQAQQVGLPRDQMVSQVLTTQTAAFELFPGPYAIAHQRLEASIKSLGGPTGIRLPIYLADTLAAPAEGALGGSGFGVVGEQIVEERERADRVKVKDDLLVILGNPPWERLKAGEAVLDAFAENLLNILREATPPDQRSNLKSARDLFVAFWLWALWAMQTPEQRQQSSSIPRVDTRNASGMIAFITNRTWIHGRSLTGLRSLVREGAREVWITDLGGDNRGTFGAKSFAGGDNNIFDIQTGAAIAWVVFGKKEHEECTVRYRRLYGTKAAKLTELKKPFDPSAFVEVQEGANGTFIASAWRSSRLRDAPTLTDLFATPPLTGIQTARDTAKYSPLAVDADAIFHSFAGRTGRGGSSGVAKVTGGSLAQWAELPSLDKRYQGWATAQERRGKKTPPNPRELHPGKIRRFLYRPLDWRHVYDDPDWITWYREDLHAIYGDHRSVPALVTITDNHGRGPAVMHTTTLMDQHSFRGSAGGKGVFPLYVLGNDANRAAPVAGLIHNLSPLATSWLERIGRAGRIESAYAYILAVLSAPSYTERHWRALAADSPRIPLTSDAKQFDRLVHLGHQLETAWQLDAPTNPLLAWGGQASNELLGKARWSSQRIVFGSGREIVGVTEAMWDFEISGYSVLPSWFKARQDWKLTAARAREIQRTLSAVEALVMLQQPLDEALSTVVGADDL